MSDPMTPQHPRWGEFCEQLAGPDGCNFQEDQTWTCHNHHGAAIKILLGMGFSADAIGESIDYFGAHGGHCDCEILFNVDPAVREDAG